MPSQLVIALLVLLRASYPAAEIEVVAVDNPAGEKSRWSSLAAGADGKLYLSWTEEKTGPMHVLRFSRWEGDRWSAARTIAEGKDWFVNFADFSSMAALADGTLAAHWLPKSAPDTFAYDIAVSISRDGGESWSPPIVPHRDGKPTEHGFVSMVPLPEMRFALFWLDGREMKGGHGHAEGNMTLRHATLTPDGTLGDEIVVDSRVCECCNTSAVRASDGALVAVYRDRSEGEIRDIGVARVVGGKLESTLPLHADGWKIQGCPVNGPAIASRGNRVAVCWYTVSDGADHVRVAFSGDGGKSFSEPVKIDDGSPNGRVDLVFLDDERVLAVWQERTAESAVVRGRIVGTRGEKGDSFEITSTVNSRAAGFPRLARAGTETLMTWTDAGSGRVRTARIVVKE